jgi:hypothetical protein
MLGLQGKFFFCLLAVPGNHCAKENNDNKMKGKARNSIYNTFQVSAIRL